MTTNDIANGSLRIVNLTPHKIVLRNTMGDTVVHPTLPTPRVETISGVLLDSPGVPVSCYSSPKMGNVIDLPPRSGNTILIVSGMVAQALVGQNRWDVYSPGTGPNDGAIRDNGQIVAVTRLIQAPQ